jgi:L-ascorbate metabolism protein UlaG (beta-lactamase superfamily)
MKIFAGYLFVLFLFTVGMAVADRFETDTIKTSAGDLEITFLGHGTLMFFFGGKVIHVDPVKRAADYTALPKADLILVTHNHSDHFDPQTIQKISDDGTRLVVTRRIADKIKSGIIMENGETVSVEGFEIEAVPAYNIVHMRSSGKLYHPRGVGNGYVITFGDKKVYVAGDTENTPEMKNMKNIDVAFLPMNLPYTMTPEMVADAAKAFKPGILYPYHYGKTDTSIILKLLEGTGIEVRIRKM